MCGKVDRGEIGENQRAGDRGGSQGLLDEIVDGGCPDEATAAVERSRQGGVGKSRLAAPSPLRRSESAKRSQRFGEGRIDSLSIETAASSQVDELEHVDNSTYLGPPKQVPDDSVGGRGQAGREGREADRGCRGKGGSQSGRSAMGREDRSAGHRETGFPRPSNSTKTALRPSLSGWCFRSLRSRQ